MGSRAAIRAGAGALSGGVGAAIVKPVVYGWQKEVQADYTLADSLLSVAFGAIMGAGLHAGGGTFGEWARARKRLPQPWECVPPDWHSEDLRKRHAGKLFGALREAADGGDMDELRRQAEAVARQFDARARNWAYHEKKTVREFYEGWEPGYASWLNDDYWREALPAEMRGGGEDLSWIGRQYEGLRNLDANVMRQDEFLEQLGLYEERFPDLHDYEGLRKAIREAMHGRLPVTAEKLAQAAMYLDPETDFHKFIEKAKDKKAGDKQSFFRLTGEGIPETANVRITSDMVRHMNRRHPDLTAEDHAKIYEIARNISTENTENVNWRTALGNRHIGRQVIDGNAYGYVFDIAGNNVTFTTFFRDNPKNVEYWFNEAKNKKASTGRGDHLAKPSGDLVHASHDGTPSKTSMAREGPQGSYYSATLHGKPSPKSLADFIESVKAENKQEPLYQFAGERGMREADLARGTSENMAALYIAKKMEARKRDAREIKLATGWERGADGKWRYEIPDTRFREVAAGLRMPSGKIRSTLGLLVDAPELFEAYPGLADMPVTFEDFPATRLGEFDGGKIRISKNLCLDMREYDVPETARVREIKNSPEYREAWDRIMDSRGTMSSYWFNEWQESPMGMELEELEKKTFHGAQPLSLELDDNALGTLAHEIQHVIQDMEGFARGGDSDALGVDNYIRASGEVEARNVERRLDLAPKERRASPGPETEDVPRERQLLLFYECVAASSRAGPLAHENVATIDDLYRLARESRPVFRNLIETLGGESGGEIHFRPGEGLKSVGRVERKIAQDYPWEGARRVVDVLGATLLYDDRAGVDSALARIMEKAESLVGRVVRVKNRFDNPSMGYRDYLVNIRMDNGFVTELLMTTKSMSEAKNGRTGVGHQIYEAMQETAAVMKRTDLSEKQLEEADFIYQKLEQASESYYGSTGDQSNLTASLSGIVEPLNWISGRAGDLETFSKVYPNVVSLLGSMRQRLPSVAVKNGTSSYSRNLSTNTVPPSGKVNTLDGAGSDSMPSRDIVSRNEGEFPGVLDECMGQPPVDGENITPGAGNGNDVLFQTAWHGTSHRFKKFSLRRIGTVEGAQVHGWGLYFAQDRKVANGYRVRLGGAGYTYKGKPLLELYNSLERSGDYDRLGVVEEFMTAHDMAAMDFSLYDPKAVAWFKKEILPKIRGDGRLYEVDIPESMTLLDEQKRLADQPGEVKASLEKVADSMPDDEQWANMAEYLYDALKDDSLTGRDLYNALATLGTKNYGQTLEISARGARKASEFLDYFGIKSITYEGHQDGRCFVIFDYGAIQIMDALYQTAPPAKGRETRILGAEGKEKARYELRELDSVIPSHNPEDQFARRADYPAAAQERPYHSDLGEQRKVTDNALNYEPGFVISTDASATNGPPIITEEGIVLGGSSRAMTLQLVYGRHPEKADAYRKALRENAYQFGIEPGAVDAMKKPMLVRVVSGNMGQEEMARRSRLYNQTTTQQLQGEAEGISRARFVDMPVIDVLMEGLKDGKTVSEFLASQDSAGFAIRFLDAVVLQKPEIAALIYSGSGGSGKLNESGKSKVLASLRGLVLPDYDIMTSLTQKTLANLDAAIPGLAISRMRGGGWDLTGAFFEAMRLAAEAKRKKIPVEQHFFQRSMTDGDAMRENPAVQALAMLFSNSDTKETRMRMEHYLSLAEGQGQGSLLAGFGTTPEQAFRKAFLEPLVFVGDERIASFNPQGEPRHAAIQWALENGGKNPVIEKALAKLEKAIGKKKIDPAEKDVLLGHYRELGAMSGSVGRREPRFGSFWRDPEKIEIPPWKKPGERGALPDAAAPLNLNDPEALLPPALREPPVVKGLTRFSDKNPVVAFFQAADVTTALLDVGTVAVIVRDRAFAFHGLKGAVGIGACSVLAGVGQGAKIFSKGIMFPPFSSRAIRLRATKKSASVEAALAI